MEKKIVFAIDTNTAGGGERVIATLANYMSAKGYDTYLINSDSSSSFYPISSKVTVLKMGLDRNNTGRIQRFIKKYMYLKRFFKRIKPDAVVSFLFNMEAPVILAGLSTKTRVFTSVRNTAWSYPKKERLFRKIFYPRITGVVFQSRQVQQFEDFKDLKNSTVIMNPMADDVAEVIQPIPYKDRRNVIISVARLEKQKNHEMLIKAFFKIADEFPDCELHIFGEGSQREYLQNLIQDLNLSGRVFLKGTVSNAIANNRDAKLFVMSSDYEGFPNALAEALVYGIPSISTDFDTGVASELISEGENGWLVDVGDVHGLSHKMKQVLLMGEETDRVAQKCVGIYECLNANAICEEWEMFIIS